MMILCPRILTPVLAAGLTMMILLTIQMMARLSKLEMKSRVLKHESPYRAVLQGARNSQRCVEGTE